MAGYCSRVWLLSFCTTQKLLPLTWERRALAEVHNFRGLIAEIRRAFSANPEYSRGCFSLFAFSLFLHFFVGLSYAWRSRFLKLSLFDQESRCCERWHEFCLFSDKDY